MINTVIFDIGMVLVEFCWQDMLKGLGFEGETFEAVADATMRNSLWQDFDRGTWPTEELVRLPMYFCCVASSHAMVLSLGTSVVYSFFK